VGRAQRPTALLDGQDAGHHQSEQVGATSPSPSGSAAAVGTGISVAVYDGTTVTGLARPRRDALKQHGFTSPKPPRP